MSDKKKKLPICPICKGESTEKYIPFCSRRCADVDLGRWLGDGYRIPTEEHSTGPSDDDEFI